MRLNAATHSGGTAINDEDAKLGLLAVGLDWRSRDVRLSGDSAGKTTSSSAPAPT